MTLRAVTTPPKTLAWYRRMAGLTGSDLAEHRALFPDFAAWHDAQKERAQ